jgi:hypothetical protein
LQAKIYYILACKSNGLFLFEAREANLARSKSFLLWILLS